MSAVSSTASRHDPSLTTGIKKIPTVVAIKHELTYPAVTKYQDNEKYFSQTYLGAMERFCRHSTKAGGELFEIDLGTLGPDGKHKELGESLCTVISWFGTKSPKKVIWLSCGMHGPELYKGAAAQLKILDNMPDIPDDTAIVMIFALNPFGCYWNRRVDADNIDPNCSFYKEKPMTMQLYKDYSHAINPTSEPSEWFADMLWIKLAPALIMHGTEELENAFVKGQYDFPKGLQYGGDKESPTIKTLLDWIEPRIKDVAAIVVIDEHTGIGPYGESQILTPSPKGSCVYKSLQTLFGTRVLGREDHYACSGGMLEAIARRVNKKAVKILINHEMGTIAKFTGLLSKLDQIKVLRDENSFHHFGDTLDKHDEYMNHWSKSNLMDAFNPPDAEWRRRGVENSNVVFRQLWDMLKEMPTEVL